LQLNPWLAVNVAGAKIDRFVEGPRVRGWRVHACRLTGRVSCPEIVFDALRSASTRYVIRIDGDTVTREDPGRVVEPCAMRAQTSVVSR